jgi:hypothetical protein
MTSPAITLALRVSIRDLEKMIVDLGVFAEL